jgi:epoxide hydrolase-like predicted phosphatase
MNSISTIFFDIGGVLVRTEDRRPRTMLADAFGMTYEQLSDIVFDSESGQAAQRGERTAAEHWEWVRERLKLRPDEIEPVRETFFSGDVLDIDFLREIRAMKTAYRLGVITNALDDARQALTGRFGLGDVFEDFVVSAEEKVIKPDERIYRIALDRLGVEPGAAVFVDDFLHNVRGAQAVGMRAVWFRGRDQAWTDLRRILDETG